MKKLLFLTLLLLPSLCLGEQAMGSNGASAHLRFKIVVPPVFKVLEVTAVGDALALRVWTNMRTAVFQGRAYRFTRVGETTLRVPASEELLIVHGL